LVGNGNLIINRLCSQGSQEQEVTFQDQIFLVNFRTFLSVSRGSRHTKCTHYLQTKRKRKWWVHL